MSVLRPFFQYYGGKWRTVKTYPAPEHNIIVEPFAGSAGYSLHYPDKCVLLIDKDSRVVETWKYLISADEKDIAALPDIEPGDFVTNYNLPLGAAYLIGWWLNNGAASGPSNKSYSWDSNTLEKGGKGWKTKGQLRWGPRVRDRIISQLPAIRHWKAIQAEYDTTGLEKVSSVTWFVDPPYEIKGRYYKYGSKQLDYYKLGRWVQSLAGQTIVCENAGATWLPFDRHVSAKASNHNTDKGASGVSEEVIYYAVSGSKV